VNRRGREPPVGLPQNPDGARRQEGGTALHSTPEKIVQLQQGLPFLIETHAPVVFLLGTDISPHRIELGVGSPRMRHIRLARRNFGGGGRSRESHGMSWISEDRRSRSRKPNDLVKREGERGLRSRSLPAGQFWMSEGCPRSMHRAVSPCLRRSPSAFLGGKYEMSVESCKGLRHMDVLPTFYNAIGTTSRS
jgi:hypothetical protein